MSAAEGNDGGNPNATIEDLRNNIALIERISVKLDNTERGRIPREYTYLGIAEYLRDEDYLSENGYQAIAEFQSGGGSSCLAFLRCLFTREPQITIRDISSMASNRFRRMDVQSFLTNPRFRQDSLLSNLSLEDTSKLARILGRKIIGAKNWKHFATEYQFTRDEINQFRNAPERLGRTSVTDFMLELLYFENPNLPIAVLKEATVKAKRGNVVKILNGILYGQEDGQIDDIEDDYVSDDEEDGNDDLEEQDEEDNNVENEDEERDDDQVQPDEEYPDRRPVDENDENENLGDGFQNQQSDDPNDHYQQIDLR